MPDFIDNPDQPPKKRRSSQRAGAAPPVPPAGTDEAEPPRTVNGRPNAAYYRFRFGKINDLVFQSVSAGQGVPFNSYQALQGIALEAKAAGLDMDSIADQRTEATIVADALMRYTETPEAIWEDEDAVLETVLKRMDDADNLLLSHVEGRIKDIDERRAAIKKLQRLGSRIRTVLSLRKRARREPPDGGNTNTHVYHAYSAAHLLRFMLYVGRSNMPSGDPGGTVFKIGRHHAKIAWDIYEAQKGIDFRFDGDAARPGIRPIPGLIPYKGVVIIAPPGHGKSEVACHFTAREICRNPETQAIMLHAISEKAEGNLRYVASCFSRDNSVGRRCMALFHVELAQSNNKKMRVKLDRPLNQSTLEAYGFMAGRLGINTNLQIWDDIVPQSDVSEEATRKRRFERLGGTWMTRQRGSDTFVLCIGTLWHHDDAVMRLIGLASKTENPVLFRVSKQRCGGPKDTPKFYPLWPEVYSQDYLRQQFATLSAQVYSANYQANPISESSRIVRRLRFYDPASEEHAEFKKRAVFYLSLDPSGTNRQHSDKAGFVYAACGEVNGLSRDGAYTESRETLRILDAKEFGATQVDLVEFTKGYAANNQTNYVLVEQAGMSAIADMFREYHGIDAIQMPVGQKSKEIRLRRVAAMLDEGQAEVGGPSACVEFPGVIVGKTSDGRAVYGPDPSMKWLYEQILDFGVSASDHCLDAVTQLAYYLMPNLRPGSGLVTEMVRKSEQVSEHQRRKLAMLAELTAPKRNAEEEDAAWFKSVNTGGY